ncbi:multidrug ABC transporter ATP-binding protein, partial [Blautia sp. MSK22_86]|nr:multidrug ABC transporter ATP-binding protein [Blautia sp. MSK22_86]
PDTRKSDDPQVGEVFRVNGADLVAAAQAFARAGLITYVFVEEHDALEESYMALTHSSAEYLAKEVG